MNKHAATHRETMALASSTVVAGYVSFLLIFFLSRSLPCFAVSSISYSEPLFQNQTLLSPNQIFELGFFTPTGSSNQYVGMWYKNFTGAKVLWVANRDRPLRSEDRLASLTIGSDGNLRLIDGDRNTVWWANVSVTSSGSTAMLLDNGNLVVRDAVWRTFIWESFHYPTDTILPGMKMGKNVKTGENQYLISWKTRSDPSPGMFSVGLTPEVPTQPFIWNGSAPRWRGGQWDKSKFIGIFDVDTNYASGFTVQQDIKEGTTYFTYWIPDSLFRNMFISAEGSLKLVKWESLGYWSTDWEAPGDPCTVYGTCGPFGICRTASGLPVCDCMEGFAPKSEEEWKGGNWIGGCIRKDELYCGTDPGAGGSSKRGTNGTGHFRKLSQLKLPDHSVYLQDLSTSAGCEDRCLSNCSCIAYSYIDNIGCLVWSEELMDIQRNGTGKDLFLRLAHSGREGRTGDDRMKIIIILTTISGIIILGASMSLISRRWRANKTDAPRQELLGKVGLKEEVSSELPMLDLKSVLRATDNFCIRNKLGQGGFGPVYKGTLSDGTEVAVKRLSSSSGQGVEEFKNEIVLISKLQHRNLVKIVGCCMEGEERILVYEYLPNKSLDTFLFDLRRKGELTWKTRFDIIRSISRGLVYLHHDSCLRVIHRDLKASNILLDEKMNPKISDFGLARIFQATQDLVNTRRVVGTIGYMSPEYAIGGMFSEKSDVYSFGVLMLEIISGKRNTSLCYLGETLSLLSYAWELWREGRAMELLDEAISADSISSTSEVLKCVQIGLLCIQDHATDRPSMSSVALMLSSEMDLPNPKAPALTNFRSTSDRETQHQEESAPSINAVTCSICEGR